MIVGYARASTADHDPYKEAPAQQLYDASRNTVQQITDLSGAPHSTVHGCLDRVPAGASA